MIRSIFVLFLIAAVPSVTRVDAADELIQVKGKYLDLTTDLQSDAEIKLIVSTFDQAVLQWVSFWGDTTVDLRTFRVRACVMRDEAIFRNQGLIPPEVPDFDFGYAMNQSIWVKAQPSEYYTRHLVLHEGVHALMFAAFDGAGTTWFQEGTAELLALHEGVGDSTRVNQIPRSREQVPFWGRFKRMDQLRAISEIPTIETIMGYQPNLIGDVGTYGWSWALVELFQGYPEYRKNLKTLARLGSNQGPEFNQELMRAFQDQWPIVTARWKLLSHDMDYGFDWDRELVDLSMDDPAWQGNPVETLVAANRGWQSVGVRVPGGIKIRLQPSGRITLAETTRPWISEPAGITFEYHRGRPLGQLLVCVLPNAISQSEQYLNPLEIHAVDQAKEFEIQQYSWLLFRVNESGGSLGDNVGEYTVTLSQGS